MAKKRKETKAGKIQQPKRVKLSAKAALQRMQAFGKRRKKFIDLPELGGKQIQLLTEAVPGLSRVGVVWDSTISDVQFRAT
jgi:hypothetical protein